METVEVKQPTRIANALRVLVADDDAPTRILLRAAISQWGYEIVEAKDGEEAWVILQQPNPPHILIVDWLMPKLDGLELCKLIKESLPILPYIILLTQISGATNITRGLDAGADEFLTKPFNMAELRSRISVGARLVQYKLALIQQKEDMEAIITEMAAYAEKTATTFQQLLNSDLASENISASKNLDQLQKNLKHLSALILDMYNRVKPRS